MKKWKLWTQKKRVETFNWRKAPHCFNAPFFGNKKKNWEIDGYEEKSDEIDMLVTDVVMPQMGGKELADKLVEVAPDLSVLFLSGYTSATIAQQGILDVDTNFLQKPFTPLALARKVRLLLDS